MEEHVLTEEMEEELVELFPFIPDVLDRARKDDYIIELLEGRDLDALAHYLEN